MNMQDLNGARAQELGVRNERNLYTWQARRAWYGHNGQEPRDMRTPEQRAAWDKLMWCSSLGEPGYFLYRERSYPYTYCTVDYMPWAPSLVAIFDVGEIEAEYTADPTVFQFDSLGSPRRFVEPGSARVIEEELIRP